MNCTLSLLLQSLCDSFEQCVVTVLHSKSTILCFCIMLYPMVIKLALNTSGHSASVDIHVYLLIWFPYSDSFTTMHKCPTLSPPSNALVLNSTATCASSLINCSTLSLVASDHSDHKFGCNQFLWFGIFVSRWCGHPSC